MRTNRYTRADTLISDSTSMVMHCEVTTGADGAVEAPSTRDFCPRDASGERDIRRRIVKYIPRHSLRLPISLFPILKRRILRVFAAFERERPRRSRDANRPACSRLLPALHLHARVDYMRVYLYYLPGAKKSRKFRSTCRGNRCHLFVRVLTLRKMQPVGSAAARRVR